jgi:diaminopropionate ammonia-lyase
MCEYLINPYYRALPDWLSRDTAFDTGEIIKFHASLPGYKPTEIKSLPHLAESLGLKNIHVKDESGRFGVNAFKPLGASYAIFNFLKDQWYQKFQERLSIDDFKNPEKMSALGSFTFCAATDGNHGRAVAWTAKMLGQKAVIYMPSNTAKTREENIEAEGAKAVLIDGTFDECVKICDDAAKQNNWIVISDTAYEGYMYYPNFIMAGYSTIFREMDYFISEHCNPEKDIVLLQAGVGGLAAAGTWFYTQKYKENRPEIICVEPVKADAFLESAKNGKPTESKKNYDSIMAGLNCGVSLVAWDYLKQGVYSFLSVSDSYAEKAMRTYFYPKSSDPQIISGESGASGMAALLALRSDESLQKLKTDLNLTNDSSVWIINSEGDTDPENFKRIIEKK